jgi:hypothetical protein
MPSRSGRRRPKLTVAQGMALPAREPEPFPYIVGPNARQREDPADFKGYLDYNCIPLNAEGTNGVYSYWYVHLLFSFDASI